VRGEDATQNLIAIDIGGTSCDISVITHGSISTKTEDEVYGHPIKGLILDIDTIGAGGGSIAWIDSGNVLQVGPMSAGADPGPVSYGRGGTSPTLTDANLILGRLDKDFSLGEEIQLNVDIAKKELEDKIAKPLGLGVIEAASGIVRIASSNIFEAIRINTIGRGIDPREYSVVAYGGAGPMHMPFIAHDLGCKSVIVPPRPGVFSATGLLSAPLMYDFVQTEIVALHRMEPSKIEGIFADLSRKAKEILEKDGIGHHLVKWERSIDMRYMGQSHEVSVLLPNRAVREDDASLFEEMFNEKYQQIFGYYSKKEPVEMVNLRLVVRSSLMMDRPKEGKIEERRMAPEYEKLQEIFFDELAGFVQCPVYERRKLGMSCEIDGPALVRQIDCTTIVPPGDYLTVDSMGNMIIRRKE
jgi:N-methylhydantoinase A